MTDARCRTNPTVRPIRQVHPTTSPPLHLPQPNHTTTLTLQPSLTTVSRDNLLTAVVFRGYPDVPHALQARLLRAACRSLSLQIGHLRRRCRQLPRQRGLYRVRVHKQGYRAVQARGWGEPAYWDQGRAGGGRGGEGREYLFG